MEDAHTTSEESAGEYHFPDSSGSSEIGFPSQDVPFSNYAHEHLWSPVCLSSPSASTDYLSNNPTPFTTPLTRLADSLPDDGYSYEARSSLRYSSSDTSTATWCEQLSWSEPSREHISVDLISAFVNLVSDSIGGLYQPTFQ
jgi:hypothetical protein